MSRRTAYGCECGWRRGTFTQRSRYKQHLHLMRLKGKHRGCALHQPQGDKLIPKFDVYKWKETE